MNYNELVEAVRIRCDVTRTQAHQHVAAVFDTIQESLLNEESIRLAGFGRFETRQRNARQARNPHTGEAVQVPAKTVVVFKPGKPLLNSLNT